MLHWEMSEEVKMKPKKLVMSAFGSYGGKEEISFEEKQQGIFLIAGDTGAGKSTIFDAIMFALFDTMSGKERKGNMMRSEYASGTEETFVEYTFSYGTGAQEKTYTVWRQPTYVRKSLRKNKNGEYGETKQNGKVILTMPDGKIFPGKAAETNQKIEEILGLTAEQFGKIVMIAQGEFQELIMDKTGKRKEIFQQIFSTQIYENIEKKISEKYKEIWVKQKDNGIELDAVLEGITLPDEEKLCQEWQEARLKFDTEPELLKNLLKQLLETNQREWNNCKEETNQAAEERKHWEETYKEAVQINEALLQWEQIKAEWQQLEAQEEQIRQTKQKIEKAQQAQKASALEQVWMEKQEERQKTKEKIRRGKSTQEERFLQNQRTEKALREAEQRKEQLEPGLQEKISLLRQQMGDYQSRDELSQQWETLQKNRKKAGEEVGRQKKDLEEKNRQILAAQEKMTALADSPLRYQRSYAKCQEIDEKKQQLDKLKKQYKEYGKEEKKQKECTDALEQKMQGWEEKRRCYEQWNLQYISNQAGILAERLKEGEPCPVCGSLSHPSPCDSHENKPVSEEMLEEAKKQEKEAEEQLEQSRTDLEQVRRKVHAAEAVCRQLAEELFAMEETVEREKAAEKMAVEAEKAAGKMAVKGEKGAGKMAKEKKRQTEDGCFMSQLCQTIQSYEEVLNREAEQEKERLQQHEKEKTVLEQLEIDLKQWQKEKVSQEEQLRLREENLHKNDLEMERLHSRIVLLEEKLLYQTGEEAKKALTMMQGQVDELEVARSRLQKSFQEEQEKIKELQGSMKELADREKQLLTEEQQAKEQFFGVMHRENMIQGECWTEEEQERYHQYLQWLEQVETMQQECDYHREKKIEVQTRRELMEKQLKQKNRIDTEPMEQKIEECRQKWQDVNRQKEMSGYVLHENSQSMERLNKLMEKRKKMSERLRVLKSLNDAANGKVHFQTYIQRQYFKQIIQAANRRLTKMNANQFLLKCRDLGNTGMGEAGLDLDVVNPLNGKTRDAHTLSGGETFMASLAMALGMADVVQNAVGYTRMETMFIDEGFGSLSEEVRDMAVRVLMELAGSKRLVGVISHVTELKEQIPDKLLVHKGVNGSHVEWSRQ